MGSIVFIHGSWHGGWCWAQVASNLSERGWNIVTPDLMGCSSRRHLLSKDLTFDRMLDDLVEQIVGLDDFRVHLVGHSSGAVAALAAAAVIPERIARLVLLDGVVPKPGASAFDSYPIEDRTQRIESARALGGLAIPVPDPLPAAWGIDGLEFGWARKELSPHPLVSFTTPLAALAGRAPSIPLTYIECTAPRHPILNDSKRIIRDWKHDRVAIDAPHDCMITHPGVVAATLESVLRNS